jgi:SAM-dependent methyltransferase
MTTHNEHQRVTSYGQHRPPSPVDRLGVWLGTLEVRRNASFAGVRFADLGCGYNASFARTQLDEVASATLVDFALADDLVSHPKVRAITGSLPGALGDLEPASLDVVLCLSVIEHLWEPQKALNEIHRILAPGGVAVLNVPSWLGKPFLEFASFRLGFSPAEEMNDHKCYYDPRDFWPMLVRAGFRPVDIQCRRHKFGLNTSAICRIPN